MTEQRLLNDDGIAALYRLANERPKLFLAAEPDALAEAMEKAAGGVKVWGAPLDLREDISALNGIEVGGPGRDAEFSRLVRGALPHLLANQGLDEFRWATINCFVLPQYVRVRWSTSADAEDPEKHPRFVRSHWMDGSIVVARRANGVARLWWLGEFSERAAAHSDLYSAGELLDAMANNVNLYHQLLSRPNLLSRPKLVAAIYEVFLEGDNEYLKATKYASELLASLNFRAAEESLDFMDLPELREVVEELKPPKER